MQRLTFLCLVVAAAIVAGATDAQAQSDRRFGVVMAYPASIGLQWQAAGNLAIRFDGNYRQTTAETTFEQDITVSIFSIVRVPDFEISTASTTRNTDLGVSVLIDVHKSDLLRLYLAPRAGVVIERTEFETRVSGLSPADLAALTFPADEASTMYSPHAGIAFGAAHEIGSRFRVFGETGATYARGTIEGRTIGKASRSTFGLRGGVGAVLLF
jgi:hypothetical protein